MTRLYLTLIAHVYAVLLARGLLNPSFRSRRDKAESFYDIDDPWKRLHGAASLILRTNTVTEWSISRPLLRLYSICHVKDKSKGNWQTATASPSAFLDLGWKVAELGSIPYTCMPLAFCDAHMYNHCIART